MTCETIQNRILALPDPRQPTEALHDHLTSCPACQAWWKQAVRLEQLLQQLPVPAAPADRKAEMIDELTAAGPVIKSIPSLHRPTGPGLFATVLAIPGLKYVGGLAAAILVVVGGWQMFRPGPTPPIAQAPPGPTDPLLKAVVECDLALARAATPVQRLEILGRLADVLSREARGLARVATEDELKELSGFYRKVVDDGILKQAHALPPALPPAERRDLLTALSAKLAETGQEADRIARESPPQAQKPLNDIANTARDGQKTLLRDLARLEG